MTDDGRLLSGFPPPDADAWRREVERLLKGEPFADRMVTVLPEGLSVSPMATAVDLKGVPWLNSMPGSAPFVRGPHAAGYHATPWWISQEHREPTCEQFNTALHESLQRGQTAVNLVLDDPGLDGLDPDQVSEERIGRDGTSLSSLSDLAVALEGVDLAAHPVRIVSGTAALPLAAMFVALTRRRQVDPASLRGCLGSDPWAVLARRGRVGIGADRLLDELAILASWAGTHAPELRTLPIDEDPWHEGGADLALGLGLTLAGAVATLRAMAERGITPQRVAPRIQFNVSVGTDFFLEMAKLRALRLLWSRVLTASGVPREATAAFIHVRTALRDQTSLDVHVNLLRATTGAMSAVMGGADSVHVSPFDAIAGRQDRFSGRLARNIQLILAHECHFAQVGDPAGGAWHVESLTRDLAGAAWTRFQSVEGEGGLPAALSSGWVQDQVAQAAQRRARDMATGRRKMVGVNAYPDPAWRPPVVPADAELPRLRCAALAGQRMSRDRERHQQALERLAKPLNGDACGQFANLIAAAEAGATLGECTGSARAPSGNDVTPIPIRRAAAPFEELRTRFAALGAAATRVLVLCLGDLARYRPRLDFARGFFKVAGCDVTGEAWHGGPIDAVAAALADGARTVVLVGQDETYADHAATVAAGLKAGTPAPTVFLAGEAGAQETAWRAAGIDGFVTRHSDVLAVLDDLATRLETRT